MAKFNYRSVVTGTLLTIEKVLDDKKWGWQKVGIILVIFAMPMGPLALAAYYSAKHIFNRKKKPDGDSEQ